MRSIVALVGLCFACGEAAHQSFEQTGGQAGRASGGQASGGTVSGGNSSGGKNSGGGSVGGSTAGGAAGQSSGGQATGGRAFGGASGASGHSTSGGNAGAGGKPSGGTGGVAQGGHAQGGKAQGGEGSGGITSFGGSAGSAGGGGVTGTAGSSGVGGAAGASSCSDPDSSGSTYPERVRSSALGTNGKFTDSCDASGNLVEYTCEYQTLDAQPCPLPAGEAADPFVPPGSGGAAPPRPFCRVPTGRVVPMNVDCGGTCRDGACFSWCATFNDELHVVSSMAGETAIENATRNVKYRCSVAFQPPGAAACEGAQVVGRTLFVTSIGNCTGTPLLTVFGVSSSSTSAEECAYRCQPQL
ncbi:MAG TPA: hypothetical protein VFQ61_07135 [Polyangiaceae bacterium]|nr:hypothetical protein [Polyangiaceae bacterium]